MSNETNNASRYTPVSYTHLDVYKRQGDKRSGNEGRRVQFGVDTTNVNGIEGIELLAKWKRDNENGLNEDNDAAWEVDHDGAGADDVDGEWVTIESDKEYNVDMSDSDKEEDKEEDKEPGIEEQNAEDSDLDLSDDETEDKPKDTDAEQKTDPEQTFRDIASSTILTPADFAKLQELRTEQGISKLMGIKNEETIEHYNLMGPVKHHKQSKEERLQSVMEGREGREKFASKRSKRDSTMRSTTNREKQRKKNFVMMIHKRSVKGKQKMSLRDKQKVLQAHVTKQKKKGL